MNEISFRVSRRTVWVGTGGAGASRRSSSFVVGILSDISQQRLIGEIVIPFGRPAETMLKELILNCGSRALMETHAAVFDRYYRISLNYRGEEPARQHQALLEYALARDVARAKSVLLDHVNGCVEHALTDGAFR